MLTSFQWLPSWQVAAAAQEASAARFPSSSQSGENAGLTEQEEDALAAELLQSFPPFGSQNNSAEWLALGVSPSEDNEDSSLAAELHHQDDWLNDIHSHGMDLMNAVASAEESFFMDGRWSEPKDVLLGAGQPSPAKQQQHPETNTSSSAVVPPNATPAGGGNNPSVGKSCAPVVKSLRQQQQELWDWEEQTLWRANVPLNSQGSNTAPTSNNPMKSASAMHEMPSSLKMQIHYQQHHNSPLHTALQIIAPEERQDRNTPTNPAIGGPWNTWKPREALENDPHNNSFENNVLSNTLPATATAPTVLRPSSLFRTSNSALDRQHWMPDQLCKQCHSCDTAFTVFRRRHHCRICGQVFCNTCSAYFVPRTISVPPPAPNSDPANMMGPAQTGNPAARNNPFGPTPGGVIAVSAAGASAPGPNASNPPSAGVLAAAPGNSHTENATNSGSGASAGVVVVRVCHLCFEHVRKEETNTSSPSNNRGGLLNATTSDELPTKSALLPAASTGSLRGDDLSSSLRGSPMPHAGTMSRAKSNLRRSSSSMQAQQESLSLEQLLHVQDLKERERLQKSRLHRGEDESTTGISTMLHCTPPPDAAERVSEGNVHLGQAAANHLEQLARHLLKQQAPLLWNSLQNEKKEEQNRWVHQLLTLATRACATVEPNVRRGDLLDIRPYCKLKTIAGGSVSDCAYLSGVVFRKTVSHKRMAREIANPRILLLSGGIEFFTRTENRFASLETLFEQEDKYMEILVGKILKLQPDIVLAGRAVSRKAQELLLQANVVLIPHVKAHLLSRIARQTGATLLSSTDHVMHQFGAKVLGTCQRFRLLAFRDNEIWMDDAPSSNGGPSESSSGVSDEDESGWETTLKSIPQQLNDESLSTAARQAALAASALGQDVLDGSKAVETGLAKRGVAQTFCLLEGCPKHLGCSIVLRGARRAALKQVKAVLRFLILAAYNLRLETSYLRERRARIRPDFVEEVRHGYSTSLCVDYGQPTKDGTGRQTVKPWNGGEEANSSHSSLTSGSNSLASPSTEISALDHGALLVTSIWMTEKSQCCPAEVKGICYYSMQDVSLGQFLRDSCFNLSLKCQNQNCKKSVLDHSLSFVHNDGLLNIVVEEMDHDLLPVCTPAAPNGMVGALTRQRSGNDPHAIGKDESLKQKDDATSPDSLGASRPIATWTYCRSCDKIVGPVTYMSEDSWKFSFGKFLESFFYNRDAILNAPECSCSCSLQQSAVLYFGCGRLSARFTYEAIQPYEVFVRAKLPIHVPFHKEETIRRLEIISVVSSDLFVKFDKHIERVSREARSLFNSAINRPEHLQTVLSELNRIGSDVDKAAKTIQEKISSVTDECRRRENMRFSEDLSRFPWFARRYLFLLMSSWNEKLRAAGKALTAMKKLAASGGRSDHVVGGGGEPFNDQLNAGIKRLRELNERYASFHITDIQQALPTLPGSEMAGDDIYDEEIFDEADQSIDFSDGVDADVLASRRRLQHGIKSPYGDRKSLRKPTKSLGTRRGSELGRINNHENSSTTGSMNSSGSSVSQPKPTPGGAVKSALTRFFNRSSRDENSYVVDLGLFSEGRPSLPPGVNGIVVPVFDEQWSSIIAYSLSSTEYAKQFKHFSRQPDNTANIDILGNDDIPGSAEKRATERSMLVRNKNHIKHTFRDFDGKGQVTCKVVCTTYWSTQFHAVRQEFLAGSVEGVGPDVDSFQGPDVEQSYIESLSSAYSWAASGGKSGASFSRTSDDRFVIKCISRTELQMFLDCAPAYFEYLSKAFFHGLPTALCKIVGVYQIGVHNRITGKRTMEQVAVMQNIFFNRKITKIFDLKGSLRGRFAANIQSSKQQQAQQEATGAEQSTEATPISDLSGANQNRRSTDASPWEESGGIGDLSDDGAEPPPPPPLPPKTNSSPVEKGPATLLDGDFLEFTHGRPVAMTDRAKAVFQMSILNDTLFLSIINVLDYSILVGVDEDNMELVVGIIDFMRQYDILKQMERVGKSLPMVVGSEAPTIIQPPLYKARFTNAMERYFMTVPSKWTAI